VMKRCPFCKGDAVLESYEEWPDCAKEPDLFYDVGCETIGCMGEVNPQESWYRTKAEAIEAWESRPIEEELREGVRWLRTKTRHCGLAFEIADYQEDRADRLAVIADALAADIADREDDLSPDDIISILDGNAAFLDKRHAEIDAIEDRADRLAVMCDALAAENAALEKGEGRTNDRS